MLKNVPNEIGKPGSKKSTLFIALFVAVVIFTILFFSVYPTICFLARFQQKKALPFCTREVTMREIRMEHPGLTVRIYAPQKETSATLIIVPGLHPAGIYDSRFEGFAKSCAESGFQVVTPDIVEFRKFQISRDSVTLISQLVLALPAVVPERSLENVGLLGTSYGAGPALVAASRKEMIDKIHFVVCAGGYYNLIHAMEYTITGKHTYGGFSLQLAPHQWGRMIFALNHIESLAPEPDTAALQKILTLYLNLKVDEARKDETDLSPAGKEFLKEVLNGLSPEETERFKKMLTIHRQLSLDLSPESIIPQLPPNLRIYLLHGTHDNLIPVSETEEMIQALQKSDHKNVRALITMSLNHVDPAQHDTWVDRLKLLLWMKTFLSETDHTN
jgi:Prolyl oligopeptidase family